MTTFTYIISTISLLLLMVVVLEWDFRTMGKGSNNNNMSNDTAVQAAYRLYVSGVDKDILIACFKLSSEQVTQLDKLIKDKEST